MSEVDTYLTEITAVFKETKDKREANYRCNQLLIDMSGDRDFFTCVLERHLKTKGNLNTLHYPVVGLEIELNEYFGLIANCWIPLPGRESNLSSKSIHHHGDMLLTTVTAYGTGYEHWTFETPSVVDASREIYELKLLEHAPHPIHHVAFVDAFIAHLPLYPPDLTITYALWSSRFPTTWKDRVKRIPVFQNNSGRLRDLAVKAGLAKQLELKVVEYFDFYPCSEGFRGMKERKEFERSNNEDYLFSLFHVIQETGNEHLAPIVEQKLLSGEHLSNPNLVRKLITDLNKGNKIEGRISANHFGFEYANFTREQILEALTVRH